MASDPAPITKYPVGLLAVLVLLILVGTVGTTASLLTARGQSAATKADVERNAELVRQVQRLEEEAARENAEHRHRNELLHSCLVDLALALADPKRDRTKPIVNPCPAPLVSHHP